MKEREITFNEAINEATAICMEKDAAVYLMGLGAPDPKGIFGTTLGLRNRFGDERVLDMPTAENGMTGIAIGSALAGMRPILTHQRIDFALLSMDQIINQAANWHYMFGGRMKVPLVIRMIVGRGWGQGPQHAQNFQSMFAHVPGLKVVLPSTPHDVKGLLISAIEDNNPVIFIEHRWLLNIKGPVPEGYYRVPLGYAKVIRPGRDLTVVAASYMTIEVLRAADILAKQGIDIEVVDVRTLKPLDEETILKSITKTGRLIVADNGWKSFGFGAEILALASEKAFNELLYAPKRISLPNIPSPTSHALTKHYYSRPEHVACAVCNMLGKDFNELSLPKSTIPHDAPDNNFVGPF